MTVANTGKLLMNFLTPKSQKMELILTREVLNYMKDHANIDYPNECCGFFYGKDRNVRTATHARQVVNAREGDKSRRFEISPRDYQLAEKYALDNDLDLLGVYHSHPDHPAEPSEHDRKTAMPYFSYIIISVGEGEAVKFRSWRLNDQHQFDEEEITTKDFSEQPKT